MKIQIAVAYHKKEETFFKNEILTPIQVGKARSDLDLGIIGDDTGDNISEKNPWYAELTATYWLWKNSQADIKGLFHYRRFLDLNEKSLNTKKNYYELSLPANVSPKKFLQQLDISKERIIEILQKNMLITRKKEDLRSWSDLTVKKHYQTMHIPKHIDMALNVINSAYPKYYKTAKNSLNGYKSYFTSILVMKSQDFDNYCRWLFGIISKVENKINYYHHDLAIGGAKSRWAGFMGERLTAIYIQHQLDLGRKVAEFPLAILIPPNTRFFEVNTYTGMYAVSQKNRIIIHNKEDKKRPKVSVAIAAYNVEKYVEQSVQSVLRQTLANIEIIAVDDGSTDNTWKILQKLASRDKRLRIIHQPNYGLAAVRNLSISQAQGEYIHFLDADDFLDNDFLEELVKSADKYNSDIVISTHKIINEQGDLLFAAPLPHTLIGHNLNVRKNIDLLLAPCHVWDKLYRLTFIRKNNLKFYPKKVGGEDIYFWWLAINKAKNVSITHSPKYNYRLNIQSSMQAVPANVLTTFEPAIATQKFVQETQNSLAEQLYAVFKLNLIGHVIFRARDSLSANPEFRKKFFMEARNFLRFGRVKISSEIMKKTKWFYTDYPAIQKIAKRTPLNRLYELFDLELNIFKLCCYYLFSKILRGHAQEVYLHKKTNYYDRIKQSLNDCFELKLNIFGVPGIKIYQFPNKINIYLFGVLVLQRIIRGAETNFYFLKIKFMSKTSTHTRLFGLPLVNRYTTVVLDNFDYLRQEIVKQQLITPKKGK
ncbi:MAG: DUF4422 domain-containing protein [Deltaproteobacteria bacterium]|jgi:glycosyltransferase involved in cell wall biosynthesis|nr:DUF4422 domain-containing protein [Deltaproteobacteria bacterium]